MTAQQSPSIKQMAARALSGHQKALRALRDDRPVISANAYPSEIRGMRTVLRTLHRWDCINDDGITDRGRELLAALDQRGQGQ
jgi:hypothetical protein